MSFNERRVVARVERLTLRELRFWVREGWVRPAYTTTGPLFDEVDIARVQLLCELKKDMSLSTDALPVVLGLIDQLHQTRRDLLTLTKALDLQPDDVRLTVAASFRDIHAGASETNGD